MKPYHCLKYSNLVLITVVFFISNPLKAEPYSLDQIDKLTAPIALYPDLLVSLILPASTTPSDIGDAAFYLLGGGDVLLINQARWAPSVKALSHYSQIIVWMSYNTPWVEQLGTAYLFQESNVLDSIQRLRQKAILDGVLKDTKEQRVVIINSIIYIEPADPELIYIPVYDPSVCFSHSTLGLMGPWIIFDRPYYMGHWLTFACDWKNHHIVSNLIYDGNLSRLHDPMRLEGAKYFIHSNNHITPPKSTKDITTPSLQPGAPQIHPYSPRIDKPSIQVKDNAKPSLIPKTPPTSDKQTERLPTSNTIPSKQLTPRQTPPAPSRSAPQSTTNQPASTVKQDDPKK
jgi:hypothetical protein